MSMIPPHAPFGQRAPFPAAKKTMQHFADGGMSQGMEDPWFEKREASNIAAYHPGGLYNTAGAGRTDNITNLVPAGAYVMPADVVSGLGEGNTLAGAAVLDKMFHSMPHGVEAPHITHGRGVGIPSSPRPFNENTEFAKGGHTNVKVPIVAAGGEFVVHPSAIIKKFGSLKRGHQVLDKFVVHVRNKTANEMKRLPGPQK